MVVSRFSDYHCCETEGILHKKQCGFRPARTTVSTLFVVRRPQNLGRARRIAMYSCFIDLQKKIDSVDREPLWTVLARFGVPEKMLATICQFHEGMRAHVRTDDGGQSAWFNVTQGLRQGCILSPLLFKIPFAAATHTVRVRFSEEPGILRDLVHLEEDGVEVEPLTCVRRSAWSMMCADDAGNVSKSAEGLAKVMKKVVVRPFSTQQDPPCPKRKRRQSYRTYSTRCLRPHHSSSKQRVRGNCTRRSFCTWAVLSTQARTSWQRSNDESESRGHDVTNVSSASCTRTEDAPSTH